MPPPWLNHWGIALGLATSYLEPLIPVHHYVELHNEWDAAWDVEPDWARTTIAGIISSLIATLAPEDPWTRASGRFGIMRIGDRHLQRDGAVLPSGEPLNDWHAVADLLGRPLHDLTTDPAYIPSAWGIRMPESAFLLAWARNGWLETKAALCIMEADRARVASKEALRWAIYRRRTYGVPADDGWVRVQFSKWALRAYHYEISRLGFYEDEIDTEIEKGKLPWPIADDDDPVHQNPYLPGKDDPGHASRPEAFEFTPPDEDAPHVVEDPGPAPGDAVGDGDDF